MTSTSTCPTCSCNPQRGLTLIELLIVIALILMVGAVMVRPVLNQVDRWAFESAVDELRGQLLLARGEAIATGRAMEVRYEPRTRRVEVRRFEAGQRAIGQSEQRQAMRGSGSGSRAGNDDPMTLPLAVDPEADAARPSWMTLDLPGGVRLMNRLPEAATAQPGLFGETMFEEQALREELEMMLMEEMDMLTAETGFRVAVYLADGSAMLLRDTWLIDGEARVMRVRINPWTGHPSMERIERGAAMPMESEDEFDDADDMGDDWGDDRGEDWDAENPAEPRGGGAPGAMNNMGGR